jgi:hypothetical protein
MERMAEPHAAEKCGEGPELDVFLAETLGSVGVQTPCWGAGLSLAFTMQPQFAYAGNGLVCVDSRRARGVAMLAPYLKAVGKNRRVEGDSTAELSVRLLATLCNCKEREAEAARDQALESGLLPHLVEALSLGVGHPSTGFALQVSVKKLLPQLTGSVQGVRDAIGHTVCAARAMEKTSFVGTVTGEDPSTLCLG